jgi:hypothetical protein
MSTEDLACARPGLNSQHCKKKKRKKRNTSKQQQRQVTANRPAPREVLRVSFKPEEG